MYIVRNLSDFELNSEQQVFVDFIKDKIGSSCSYEEIKNKNYKKKYASPINDFVVYNSSMPCAEPTRLLTNRYRSMF